MTTRIQWTLPDMLKTLADDKRLLMLRLLHEREHTVGELAGRVELGEPTVSHHLAKLRENGFVTLRMAGNQRFYRANEAGLNAFKRFVSDIEKMPQSYDKRTSDESWIDALGWSAEDAQVLRDCTRNGVMTLFPAKRKKQLVLLRWLATLFEADRMYTEPEVNAILKRVYAEDFVTLRRDLVDMGYLRRERGGGKYWVSNE
jgi:predicted transcriptional regulator